MKSGKVLELLHNLGDLTLNPSPATGEGLEN